MPQGSGATRNIAETIGKQPKQIKALVLLGERLLNAQAEPRDE